MAHIEKFKRGSASNMTRHVQRARGKDGQYLGFGNDNIDPTLSPLNYNLASHQKLPQMEFLNKRIGGLKRKERKDANILGSVIVTFPKSYEYDPGKFAHIAHLSEHDREGFFVDLFMESSYKFLEERLGKKNVVSAYVHMDELTPHQHFYFLPISEVDGEEVLNWSKAVPQKFYQTLHQDLHKYLLAETGVDFEILNGSTKEKEQKLDRLDKEIGERGERVNALESETREYTQKRDGAKNEYHKLEKEVTRLAVKTMVSPELRAAKEFMGAIRFSDGTTALKRFEDIQQAKVFKATEQAENSRKMREGRIDLSHIPDMPEPKVRQHQREFSK